MAVFYVYSGVVLIAKPIKYGGHLIANVDSTQPKLTHT